MESVILWSTHQISFLTDPRASLHLQADLHLQVFLLPLTSRTTLPHQKKYEIKGTQVIFHHPAIQSCFCVQNLVSKTVCGCATECEKNLGKVAEKFRAELCGGRNFFDNEKISGKGAKCGGKVGKVLRYTLFGQCT